MDLIKRCVNLDWLEVHAIEPSCGLTPEYFNERQIWTSVRPYGTRVFRQMFTIYGTDGEPLLEIRRQPVSNILSPYDVHIRLVNRTCYLDDAITQLVKFMRVHNYVFRRIVRIDICLDFERFDSGDDPKKFLNRYLQGVYSKINQASISAHGNDDWDGRDWNSISWGSITSDVGTKLYDKTMELYDSATKKYKKPYIRQAWQATGLVDDFHNVIKYDKERKPYTPRIWRIEFSIRSSVKSWFLIEKNGLKKNKQSIRNTLDMYDNRSKLLTMFASLQQHYFHFKYYKEGQRKDRCPDKVLFIWRNLEVTYKVEKVLSSSKPDKPLASLLNRLKLYKETHFEDKIREACSILIKCITDEQFRYDAGSQFTREEIKALQMAVSLKSNGADEDVIFLIREIKEFLRLNHDTAPF